MAGTIVLRGLQILCLLGVVLGAREIGPLSSEIRLRLDGEPGPLPRLCVRIAAAAGPIVVSLVVMGLLEVLLRNMREERKLREAHPHEPWLWKPQWAAKHMRLSNKPLLVGWLCFFLIYLSVGVPLAIASEKTPFMVFAGIFGLGALIVLRMLWQSRKWNQAELRISTLPGVIGGPFTGAVILKQKFPPTTVFDVNLKCELSTTQRHHKKTETKRIDKWSSTLYIEKPLGGSPAGTTAIPISFAIPYNAMPTGTVANDTVRWVLSVQKKEEVSTGGASFEIPVYKTADSRQNYELDKSLIQKHLAVLDPGALLKRFALQTQQLSADHMRLHFREFDFSIFATLGVMSVGLIAVLIGMWFWIKDSNTLLFAMVFPGVFLLMFLYGLIHMLFWRLRIDRFESAAANQPEMLAELDIPTKKTCTIEAEAGIWGLRKTIRVVGDRTTVLRCKIDHRANNQESWSIWLCGTTGEKLKILSTFRSAAEANAAAKFLAEKLGISAGGITAEDGFLK